MSSYDRDIDDLGDLAKRQGWRMERGNNGHYKFFDEKGVYKTTASSSPSDVNAIHQVRRDLRYHGFKFAEDLDEAERAAKEASRPEQPQEAAAKPKRIGLTAALVKILESNPLQEFALSDLAMQLGVQFPGLTSEDLRGIASNLMQTRKIFRPRHGFYRWADLSAETKKKEPELPAELQEAIDNLELAVLGATEVIRKLHGQNAALDAIKRLAQKL